MFIRTFALLAFACSSALAQPRPQPEQPREPAPPPVVPAPAEPFTPLAHIETSGTGPVHLILVPGLSCDWTVWKSFMDRNAQRYTMHAVTLPGFGASDPPPRPQSAPVWQDLWLSNAQRAILKAADDLKLARPVLVGHSLGAHLALRTAIASPGRFASVIAVDGFPAFPIAGTESLATENRRLLVEGQMAQWFDRALGQDRGAGLSTLYRSMVTSPARADSLAQMAEAVPAATAKAYFLELMSSDVTEPLKACTTPTLLLAALDAPNPDNPEVSRQARDSSRALWTAQARDAKSVTLIFIEPSRHFIMDDQPAKLDELVAGFIAAPSAK